MPDQEISEITPTAAKFDKDECNCAAAAIDKDLSTVAYTSTIDGFGMLEIEYGKTFFLRKVIIHYWFFSYSFYPTLSLTTGLKQPHIVSRVCLISKTVSTIIPM